MVIKIRAQMAELPLVDLQGRTWKYGEFFPNAFCHFAYNESLAQELFPLTKEVALAAGYTWKDPEEKNPSITMTKENIPNSILDVSDMIAEAVIGCTGGREKNPICTVAFKILPDELKFYRYMSLPIPDMCPNCRHLERMKWHNPLKLWKRSCMCTKQGHSHTDMCSNEFETTYSPDRKEIVYCESCYQKEVL